MSLFQKLTSALGVGGAKVEVAVSDQQYFRGGAVSGVVLLQGGEAEQEVGMLTVDLVEHWVSGSGKNRTNHQRQRDRVVAAQNVRVGSGVEKRYTFLLTMPADARCSRMREGWRICAEAHIAWAVDARCTTELKVLPQPEVLAIQRAAKGALGLVPVQWDGSRPEVFYDFSAPPVLKDQLDGISFRLQVNGDLVEGEMVLNKQEHGVGGMLGALVGADKECIPLAIPRAELLTRRGSPNPAGAVGHLRALLAASGIHLPEPPPAPPAP